MYSFITTSVITIVLWIATYECIIAGEPWRGPAFGFGLGAFFATLQLLNVANALDTRK